MIAHAYSTIPKGYQGSLIKIEADASQGLPAFNIVGMAGKTVSEARERVRSAISNSGLSFPDQRVTINLAPAELHKEGTFLDLPIALAILALSKQLHQADLDAKIFVGELSLNGQLRPVRGIINIVEAARSAGYTTVVLPKENLPQAALVSGVNLIGTDSLNETIQYLKHQFTPTPYVVKNNTTEAKGLNLPQIRGQSLAKRALTIAVAGHHNILISGPPGAGKTLLARAAVALLPPLTPSEQISVTKIHSLAGLTDNIVTSRPFRTPHHTSSLASLTGGGAQALPGEISLAHLGVLFLDEFPEYPRHLLESLRQPLEDRQISIARANFKTTYPADFMLIATMNPCPCGYLGDPTHECTCTPNQITTYQQKLSGPLLDRIDLRISVERVPTTELTAPSSASSWQLDDVKNTISGAIERQHQRFQNSSSYNAHLSPAQISQSIKLHPSAKSLLAEATERLNLSARSYFKVIKVATTIADLANSDIISPEHISEALAYR